MAGAQRETLTVAPQEPRAAQTSIADHYRRLIRSGRMRSGERLPSLRRVAHEFGVSVMPARVAFEALESEGLVHRRHGLGNFVGREHALLPTTFEIGILFRPVPRWREVDNYILRVFQGLQEALQREEHRTLLVTVPRAEQPLTALPPQFLDQPAHGYIVDEPFSEATVARFAATGRPVVVVNRGTDTPGVDSVFRDGAWAGAEVARQALSKGHRIVGCVSTTNWNDRLAVRGFVQGLAEAGVELPSVRRASYVAYRDDPAHLYEGLLAARPAPTMIFCANDRIARSFLRWVHRTGRVVPDDVSIVGTQDMRIEKHLTPPLTTVRFGPENLGRKAVETLLARCREPDREARAVAIPGEWVERASLACAERRRT